jgi:predicted aconitase with swiveling domain
MRGQTAVLDSVQSPLNNVIRTIVLTNKPSMNWSPGEAGSGAVTDRGTHHLGRELAQRIAVMRGYCGSCVSRAGGSLTASGTTFEIASGSG